MSSSAARSGVRPRTSCAQIISGIAIAVIAKLMVTIATFERVKFRSLNRLSGTSGSLLVRAW